MRQSEARRIHNRSQKGVIKARIKKVLAAVEAKDRVAAEKEFRTVTKLLDRAGDRNLVHPNYAARKKSALAIRINSIGK